MPKLITKCPGCDHHTQAANWHCSRCGRDLSETAREYWARDLAAWKRTLTEDTERERSKGAERRRDWERNARSNTTPEVDDALRELDRLVLFILVPAAVVSFVAMETGYRTVGELAFTVVFFGLPVYLLFRIRGWRERRALLKEYADYRRSRETRSSKNR